MHPFNPLWCFQGWEKGCIENEWVKFKKSGVKPVLSCGKGDLKAKSSNWFCQDKPSFEGDATGNLTSQFELHQVIKEPTHILDTSLCIDLIFTS